MAFSISGLSGSGLDVTSLVEQLMEVERQPLTTLQNKKSNLQSQQSVFRQLNTKLNALQYTMNDLNLEAAFKINKGLSSNANVASLTAQSHATAGTYNVQVKNLASFEVQTSNAIDGTAKTLAGQTFTIGAGPSAKNISLSSNSNLTDKEILDDLVNKINKSSAEYGATAALIDTDGTGKNLKLSLTATKASDQSQVAFTLNGSSSNPLTKTVEREVNGSTITEEVPVYGQKATVLINGIEVKRENNNFDNIVSGISLTAKEVGTTQITVGKDTDTITANVQKFVDAYNEVVDFVNTNIAKPTAEGAINPLQNDSVLKQLKNDLYSMFSQGVATGETNGQGVAVKAYMEELGLKIDANLKSANQFTGKITFDQAKFKTNLNENAEKVQNLFGNIMDSGTTILKSGYTETFKGQIASKISGFDNQIKAADERLEIMNRSLTMKQARLKSQFNAMETMLLSLNNQSSWLKSQFDGLTKANSN